MERGTFQGTNVKSLDKDPQQMSVQPRIELRYLGHTGPCSAPHISLLPFLSRPTVRCREQSARIPISMPLTMGAPRRGGFPTHGHVVIALLGAPCR